MTLLANLIFLPQKRCDRHSIRLCRPHCTQQPPLRLLLHRLHQLHRGHPCIFSSHRLASPLTFPQKSRCGCRSLRSHPNPSLLSPNLPRTAEVPRATKGAQGRMLCIFNRWQISLQLLEARDQATVPTRQWVLVLLLLPCWLVSFPFRDIMVTLLV